MTTARLGLASGLLAGVVALGCCVGPAVGALLGITSAVVAVDLANDLYATWGWAFKLAGAALGAAALYAAWRRSRRCEPGERRGVGRFATVLVASGVLTYGLLYAGTTWAGGLVDEPSLQVSGDTVGERVRSAMAQVRRRYPHFVIHKHFAAPEATFFNVGFEMPERGSSVDDFSDEVRRRAENFREATVLLLQTVARSNPTVTRLSAFEDNLVVPVWTRRQILEADSPSRYRDYEAFTALQVSAHDMGGYTSLSN